MSKPNLNFYVIARKQPGTNLRKFYGQKASYSNIKTEDLLSRIVENTAVPRGVVRSAVNAIFDSIENFVLNGHSVELGGLMSLRPVIKAKMIPTPFDAPVYPSQLDKSTRVRIVAYWGNDVRKFQNPDYYDFTKVVKADQPE